jgi:glycosyltransferase involved in cell wall biosynthesis
VTQSRQRIVFVATDLSTGGGVNRVIRDLSGILADQLGHEVRVLAARSSAPPTYASPESVRVELRGGRGVLHYVRELWRLRKSRPDWVIGSWTQDNILLIALFLFSATRVAVVEHSSWDFHGPVVRALRWLIYPAASRVVTLNPTDLAYYSRKLSNVVLIPNPVTIEAERRHAREKIILGVGHLSPVKNFGDAVKAMALSGLEKDGWALTLIGSGSEKHGLEKLAREEGLKRFSIEEGVTNLPDWYARASFLLVTSRTEVFSLVLAEAMAAGVVPIAYGADGPKYLLDDFPDLLVDQGDVAGLAKQLSSLAQSTELDLLRPKLRNSVKTRFSPTQIVEEWREVLS